MIGQDYAIYNCRCTFYTVTMQHFLRQCHFSLCKMATIMMTMLAIIVSIKQQSVINKKC